METKGFFGRLFWLMEWVTQFLYLDLLWAGFSLAGLIVAGLMPATAAMYAVTRKWVMGETDVPVFRTFWQAFKADFLKANLLGWSMLLVGFVLYVDIRFFRVHGGLVFAIVDLVVYTIAILYMITWVYIFPVFVHYDINNLKVVKYSLLIGLSHPIRSVVMLAFLVFVAVAMRGILPALSISLLCYVVMWSCYRVFRKIEQRVAAETAQPADGVGATDL